MAKHHPDLLMCKKHPGIAFGRLCEKCDGKCVTCDSYGYYFLMTASHLPYKRNRFKFFTNAGGLGKADIKDILERVASIYSGFTPESLKEAEKKASSSINKLNYMSVYASDLVAAVHKASRNIEKTLEGFHIVVDAGNGAGGFFDVSL